MRKTAAGLIFLTTLVSADDLPTDIRMPDIVLDAIKHCECLKENGECNPNVIRINAVEEAQRAAAAGFAVEGHLIRCGSSQECSVQAQALIEGGIVNLDLGPYQINYKYHPNPMLHEYFEESTAREQANAILTKLVKSFGYSWETLGRYHHFSAVDRTRNERYYRKMYAFIYGDNAKAQGSE
ncbi:MAG: hypothetical protein AB7U44_09515 [Sulfuricurvum sp.]|uniref:hypothetical protein n=1 Tax=Sulfuricurvum sp. TaxID=2025608 RepID=UPI002632BBE1|nr:hypothetical protein [Sulfuricurvum sp.]MDD2838737.1 hypothetical protein [Sulfuricurvum sp.]MDD3596651.1 hypothetical protein [Sulfuricurvum sp.]